jgi:hypothetical protein
LIASAKTDGCLVLRDQGVLIVCVYRDGQSDKKFLQGVVARCDSLLDRFLFGTHEEMSLSARLKTIFESLQRTVASHGESMGDELSGAESGNQPLRRRLFQENGDRSHAETVGSKRTCRMRQSLTIAAALATT